MGRSLYIEKYQHSWGIQLLNLTGGFFGGKAPQFGSKGADKRVPAGFAYAVQKDDANKIRKI